MQPAEKSIVDIVATFLGRLVNSLKESVSNKSRPVGRYAFKCTSALKSTSKLCKALVRLGLDGGLDLLICQPHNVSLVLGNACSHLLIRGPL